MSRTGYTGSSSNEMTAGSGESSCGGGSPPGLLPPPPPPPPPPSPPSSHRQRRNTGKRRSSQFGVGSRSATAGADGHSAAAGAAGHSAAAGAAGHSAAASAACSSADAGATSSSAAAGSAEKKRSQLDRKSECPNASTIGEGAIRCYRRNHGEIEKQRRDKISAYISELAALVPACGSSSDGRRPDKLTVLRHAVEHVRNAHDEAAAAARQPSMPHWLANDAEANALVANAARDVGAWILTVACEDGRLCYVSTSVSLVLHYAQEQLVGRSVFEFLHPKDTAMFKEQLMGENPREHDDAAGTSASAGAASTSSFSSGSRRAFSCRFRCKSPPRRAGQPIEKKYRFMYCTGYLRWWASAEMGAAAVGVKCLVAVVRPLVITAPPHVLAAATAAPPHSHAPATAAPPHAPAPASAAAPPPPTRALQFTSRHSFDGEYLFVDARVTHVLGYMPHELLGVNLYELVSGAAARQAVSSAHFAALRHCELRRTPPYAVRRQDGSPARLITSFKPIRVPSVRNPWVMEIQFLMAQNTLVGDADAVSGDVEQNEEERATDGGMATAAVADADMLRLHARWIGSFIAEKALQRSIVDFSPDLPPYFSVIQPTPGPQALVGYDIVENDPPSRAVEPGDAVSAAPEIDGNEEASLSVIMSILEADAGLGGPIDFDGLPWPLP